jgi:hypothetical protein
MKSDRFDPASHDDPGCAGGFAEARADSSDNHLPNSLFGIKCLESSDHAGLESAKLG